MVLDIVSREINSIRAERGLSRLMVDRSTQLEDLGFDSLMYALLVARVEQQCPPEGVEQSEDDITLPTTVGDLVDLFGTTPADLD